MKNRKVCLIIAFIWMIVSGTVVYADPVNLNDILYFSRGPGNGPGGEFKVNDVTSSFQFNTFCIEADEYIAFGSPFIVGNISNTAMAGGKNTNSGDLLDPRTAYLYYHFRMGDLSGYQYGTNTSADELQEAIWAIEQENIDINGNELWTANGQALVWIQEADGKWSDIGNVRVINLVDSAGNYKQDQLVLVPEPSTLLLLGAGLVGLGILGRKKFRTKP